jgi:sugar phosphate isomerase/epimerase
MKTIKGPAIFLAQFVGEDAPFNSLDSIAAWAADLGYKGIQVPSGEPSLIDLELAAESQSYCDDLRDTLANHGIEITELSTQCLMASRLHICVAGPMRVKTGQ